jgi:pseudaminic acid biosynthesis-associated methylase
MKTPQIETWTSEFGREYTDRNALDIEALNALYVRNYGITRQQLNTDFLAGIRRDARILEVGCNMGNQLLLLEHMGFHNLFGIEVQPYALEKARSRLKHACLTEATAFDIPYPDQSFDLVFTSGVLIHIAPSDLPKAVGEIHRCSRNFIWGLEYHAPNPTEVNYRGHDKLLWKMDYLRFYRQQFADLQVSQSKLLPYLENDNQDCMFLLQKKTMPDPR